MISVSWTTGPRQGFAELDNALQELIDAAGGELLSAAIQPAAELVLETAQRLVPRRSDAQLARSLFAEEEVADAQGASWVIGCEKKLGWYAVMVEFGTAPHEERKGAYVHPGAGPRPFLRPALDTNQDEIVRLIGEGIAKNLEAVGVSA